MAVYHPLSDDELTALCRGVGLTFEAARAVPQGSINTNYVLACAEGRYFLRLTHVRRQGELDFEAALLAHLKGAGFPCARPLSTHEGRPYQGHSHGLVSVFPYQPGEELPKDGVTPEHAFRAGEMLGKMHRLGGSFPRERENPYGEAVVAGWLSELSNEGAGKGAPAVVREALPTLRDALSRARDAGALPQGAIHADYFRDNVKWLGDRISAVLDFEMACTGPFMLDVGIGLCEWAYGDAFDRPRMREFLSGYRTAFRPRPRELSGLYEMALFAAARYTLSRIRDFHLSPLPEGALSRKDFRRYLKRAEELLAMKEPAFQDMCGIS